MTAEVQEGSMTATDDSRNDQGLTPAQAVSLAKLVEVAPAATVSRVIARTSGGSVTLFAFAANQEISEHSAPFDAMVQVLDGDLEVTIGGEAIDLGRGEAVLMPANVPHALRARSDCKMQLIMLREPEGE
jgi:quercetin dioxygenase-like cupin family protein